jgi:hypothetical protein
MDEPEISRCRKQALSVTLVDIVKTRGPESEARGGYPGFCESHCRYHFANRSLANPDLQHQPLPGFRGQGFMVAGGILKKTEARRAFNDDLALLTKVLEDCITA